LGACIRTLGRDCGPMTDASYYSVIERDEQGRFFAWVPDLPGLKVAGETEADVVRALSQQLRQCLRDIVHSGRKPPHARPLDGVTRAIANQRVPNQRVHRLLLLIG
jgi:predicted RNase H-like HicB family nuclease